MTRAEREVTMLASVGLDKSRRINWYMMVNLRVAMLSEIGLHAKKIVELVNHEFGCGMSCGQIHTRNKKRGRKLRDARDGATPYIQMQIKAIQAWPRQKIERLAPLPAKQIEGSNG
jgi:hypothetical protein